MIKFFEAFGIRCIMIVTGLKLIFPGSSSLSPLHSLWRGGKGVRRKANVGLLNNNKETCILRITLYESFRRKPLKI